MVGGRAAKCRHGGNDALGDALAVNRRISCWPNMKTPSQNEANTGQCDSASMVSDERTTANDVAASGFAGAPPTIMPSGPSGKEGAVELFGFSRFLQEENLLDETRDAQHRHCQPVFKY